MRVRILLVCAIVASSAAAQEVGPVAPPTVLRAFGSGEGNWRGSPVVADITGDGRPEIIVSVWGQLIVYSAAGDVVWTAACAGRNFSGAVVGDVDGDGSTDVIFADNGGVVHVLDRSGKMLPGWPQTVRLEADVRSIACADVDGDGVDEVVVFSSLTDRGCEPNMYVYEGTGKVKKGWPHYHPKDPYLGNSFNHAGAYNHNLAVGDLNGDGQMECVFPQDYGSISIFSADGVPIFVHPKFRAHGAGPKVHWGEVRCWCNSATERTKWGEGADYFLEFTLSPATIADIDLDGKPEVLAVPNLEAGKVGPWKGSALAVYNLDRTHKQGFDPLPRVTKAMVGEGVGGPAEANPVAVAGDITGDAKLEIVVTHADGTCRAYDWQGRQLWSVQVLPDGNYGPSEPLLADVTADSRPDVILLASRRQPTRETELIVIDGEGRRRLSFKMGFFTLASPTIADVTGDGQPELVLVATYPGDDGRSIHVYTWDALNPDCIVWPTARGDFAHTACLKAGPKTE